MDHFNAWMITGKPGAQDLAWAELTLGDLMPGNVTVAVSHSTLNYKDGLAMTGKAPVVRRWPMIPGIDFAGTVTHSEHPEFNTGDDVILNGWGVGEVHYGGYAGAARVNGDWLIARPVAFTNADAMAIGTAGYTAMLCVMALEKGGITPSRGPIVVTGASGGVGSIAVAILGKLGYTVIAVTGRMEEEGYLKSLGASDVRPRAAFSAPARPLSKEEWAGGIDVAGSHTLANVISRCAYGGVVAACGLAHGMDLSTNVAPFILRSVTLCGIDSVQAAKPVRLEAWDRLAKDLPLEKLQRTIETHDLKDAAELAHDIVAGRVRGRILFDVACSGTV
jgi:acrylyl-CoA reductase (NADPH)